MQGHAMNNAASINTWELLRDFGFQRDADVISDPMPGLTFDFGNIKLSASRGMNLRFVEVVSFTGVLATPRRIAEIEFEMPFHVTSREQCAAWIVWHLDQASGASVFTPTRPVDWLGEGRSHKNLLPWVSDLVAYRARPKCMVDREWMRLALKALGEMLALVADEEEVFAFDGAGLMIRCGGKVVPLMADGEPWPVRYAVAAGNFRQLPKRLMNTFIEVSVWDSKLGMGGRIYPCIEDWQCEGSPAESSKPEENPRRSNSS